MTLVQACIADNGKVVILIADRLLTRTLSGDLPPYEFESRTPKLIRKGQVGIGFAGSSLYAEKATASIHNDEHLNDIVKTISACIKNETNHEIDSLIKKETGVDSNQFFTDPQLPIPVEVRGYIYAKIHEFDISFDCLVAGIDDDGKASIHYLDNEGNFIDVTTFGFFPIGSGAPFSIIYFDQYGYEPGMSRNEALLFAFEAKKWAQAHTGVGNKTDILVFEKDEEPMEILNGSEEMMRIDDAYENEIKNRKEFRESLLLELFGKGEM
ncbi:MAG: hypothetical protein ACTSX2_05345 [Candidatus Thorarchaeota archaeon]